MNTVIFVGFQKTINDVTFEFAAERLKQASFRSELLVQEIAPPGQVASQSIAFSASLTHGNEQVDPHVDSPYGAGRLILLHNTQSPDEWGAPFRFVCFAQAPLELEIGTDPFIANVAWSWLLDALDSRKASFVNESGTATKTISTGFGSLATQTDVAQIEIRASWTPMSTDFERHAEAWGELLCLLGGLPHEEGIASLGAQRTRKKQK